jgi:anti-sigma-K factor RskA
MIDERMEEQASLHVLGALTETEAKEFKKAMAADPELKEFVARLSIVTSALAETVKQVEPPPQLRAKILARIAPQQKIVSLPERKSPLQKLVFWLACGLATCFALICALLLTQDGQLRRVVHKQANQISELNQLAQSLQTATNDLQRAVVALRESNRLANLKITMLNSLIADAPKTVAVTLWDGQQQHGAFVVQNLKTLPADQDYELWVIDEKKQPVAAGVFHTDESGTLRMDFKPVRSVQTAGQFAVTIETKGGVDSPTLKNLVLASN